MSINFSEIHEWIENDPDPRSAELLQHWIDTNNLDELQKSFNGFLEFGTAGLRGPIRPGPSGMNRAVVGRAASGIALYMQDRGLKTVVIGRDARHGSEDFTQESAKIFSGYGMEVFVLPRPLPTPVLAFAVNELKMDCGIMVTASHNPPQDNGYKVYLGGTVDGIVYNGSQIITPTDKEIASKIATISQLKIRGDKWTVLHDSILDKYVERNKSIYLGGTDLKVVYTAMHGVGTETLVKLFEAAHAPTPILVSEQCDPDPDFPTVAFPNPEEPGAMDLALATAAKHDADFIIANDPDADRAAAAMKDRDGQWRNLRGDEVGIALGYFMATQKPMDIIGKSFANSIVSSSALSKIAAKFDIEFHETLTGFKYLAKIPNLAFGYEEALGYAVDPQAVNDKDGISAALMLTRMMSWLKSENRPIYEYLDEIWGEVGYHATQQISIRVSELSKIPVLLDSLRNETPTHFGQFQVTALEDLAKPTNGLPPTNGLRFFCSAEGNDRAIRIIMRPSGTEAKMKIYLEVSRPAVKGEVEIMQQRQIADSIISELHAAVSEIPQKFLES